LPHFRELVLSQKQEVRGGAKCRPSLLVFGGFSVV